jgi:hypothetical protein
MNKSIGLTDPPVMVSGAREPTSCPNPAATLARFAPGTRVTMVVVHAAIKFSKNNHGLPKIGQVIP